MAPLAVEPTPKTPLKRFLALAREFLDEPLPPRVGWTHVFGGVLLFLLAIQALTGFLLALYYSPSTATAYESVKYIQERAIFGGLIRGMHRWSANLLIVTLGIHIARVFIWGAYKAPRRWTWVSGCLLLLIVLGFGFTGYLLPWDLKAYFGTEVGTHIAGSAPGVGPMALTWLRGGSQLGQLTLPRFYAIHVLLLPALLVIGVVWHLWQIRGHGITPPWVRVGEERGIPRVQPFFPFQAARDNAAMLAAFLLLIALAVMESRGYFGPPLGEKADPSNADYIPRPDWYFLGLQHLLRIFPAGFGQVLATTVIPGLAVVLLLAVPFLDRNPERSPRRRPVAMALGAAVALTVILLTLAGDRAVRREERALNQRLAAAKAKAETQAAPTESAPRDEADLIAGGEALFEQLKCGLCHSLDGPPQGGVPTLAWEGSRVREAWLRVYLKNPTRIHWETNLKRQGERPRLRMPNFELSDNEVDQLTAFLTSKQDPQLIPPQPELEGSADPAAIERGEKLVHETHRCTACHRIGDDGTPFGPDLTHIGLRGRPDFLYAIIHNPQRLDSRTKMKNLRLAPDEVIDAVRYLTTLK